VRGYDNRKESTMRNTSRKQLVYTIILLATFLILPGTTFSASPVLNFSDIDSGPKTGNSDGAGGLTSTQHGAIVTIWGNNLGSSQGTSNVYIGGVAAAHVYYWKDADGAAPGGPADLKTFHKMQEIAFSIPAGAPSGATTIGVSVGGVNSNTLPFTVRSGNIKFIKSTGSDSTGTGTWSSPYQTLASVFTGGNGKAVPGDVIYAVGVGSTSGINVGNTAAIKGTAANPVALIAYPNTAIAVSGMGYDGAVIYNYYYTNATRMSEYINLSKLSITANGVTGDCNKDPANGVVTFNGNRLVGLEITGPTVYGGYGGAITCSNGVACGGGKYFGIYIHNYGTVNSYFYNWDDDTWTSPTNSCFYAPYAGAGPRSSVDRFQHLYYISNRTGSRVNAYEIGWNHLTDNPILHGIHIYDTPDGAGWNGTMVVHHNVVKNQRGNAIDIVFPGSTPVQVYDNLVIADAAGQYTGFSLWIDHSGSDQIYNNTVYGSKFGNVIRPTSFDFRNNIIVDTAGPYFLSSDSVPTSQSNNLFYSTGTISPPSWATSGTGNIKANPLFTNAANNDFSLSASSPAKNTGSNTTLTVAPTDFLNLPRTNGNVSIGAFGLSFNVPPPSNASGYWK